jgi:serine O-acetyltransferase
MNPIFLQKISYKLRFVPIIPILITYLIRFVFGCYLPYKIKIGKNFVLGYGGLGVVIHERTILGEDCHIDQNVTIGGTSKKYGLPKLGNHIYVGAGAKIIGPITIGDNVVIGANAVVIKDVPSGSLVVGIPGKIIKSSIKKSDYI